MKRILLFAASLTVSLLAAGLCHVHSAEAQEAHRHRHEPALREFETSLLSTPNRFNGLYGAARAARLAADQKRAQTYYGKLAALCRSADTVRPEVEEAKEFLARARAKGYASAR